MTLIVHISDTHFGTEVPEVMAAAENAIRELTPDLIILSGDITQRARKHQFADARSFLDRTSVNNVLIVPGNHDIPLFNVLQRFTCPYHHYKKAFTVRESLWLGPKIAVIGLDATSVFRHTRGYVSDRKLKQRIGEAKSQSPKETKFIACIHQPLVTAWPEDNDEVLLHAQRTAHILSEEGIDLVLSGHVHVPILTTTHQYFADVPRHFILAGAGTAISHRTRPGAPNSFNVISLTSSASCDIRIITYSAEQTAFVVERAASFTCEKNGWI